MVPGCAWRFAPLVCAGGLLSRLSQRMPGKWAALAPPRPPGVLAGVVWVVFPVVPNTLAGARGAAMSPPHRGKGGKRGKGAAEPAESGSPQGWSPLAGGAARPAGPRPGGRGACYAAPTGAGR